MMIFMALVLMGTTSTVTAEPSNKLDIICCSYHFNRDAGYNELNLGLKYTHYYHQHRGLHIGGYKNSEYNMSYFVGIEDSWELSEDFAVSLGAGIVTGYERTNILPYILPTISYKDTLHLTVFPVDDGGAAMALTTFRW